MEQCVFKQKLMQSLDVHIHTVSYLHLLMWEDEWVWSQERVVEISREKSSHHCWGCSEGNGLLIQKVTWFCYYLK